jgi:hypothetical protein
MILTKRAWAIMYIFMVIGTLAAAYGIFHVYKIIGF